MTVRARILATAAFALALHASVVAIKTFMSPGRTILAVFGVGEAMPPRPAFVDREGYPIQAGTTGTDGQQYLYIAHDPLGRNAEIARALDEPRYRYGRILLPAIAAAICAGSSPCLPRAIVGGNLFFAAVIGALLALLVADRQAHPGWGFALAASGGLIVATDIANVELCAQAFALAGVVLAARHRIGAAAAMFACAALARETYALVPIGFAAASALERRPARAAAYLASCVPITVWMMYLRVALPGPMGVSSNLGLPFAGIAVWVADFIRQPRLDSGTFNRFSVGIPLVSMMVRHAAALRRDRSGLAIAAALVSVLGICAAPLVWRSPGGFARGLDFLYPGIVLPALERRDRLTAWLSLASAVVAISTIGDHILHGAAS